MAVSFTTIAGYILYSGHFSTGMILPVLGIFLLASGSSALNHIQESSYDQKMERTQNRPIPSGRIKTSTAWLVSLVYTFSGSIILFLGSNLTGLLLGWTALVWYNLIYTYLKRITPYAVIPGSVIGAIPPVVGWVAAGGPLLHPRVVPIMIFFFIWQVPHFWLLMIKYGRQYENAGYPSITSRMEIHAVRLMIFLWVAATSIVGMLIPLTDLLLANTAKIAMWLASLLLVLVFIPFIGKSDSELNTGKYFRRINYYVLAAVLILILDHTVLAGLEESVL